jgi:uncharacterized membrane protein
MNIVMRVLGIILIVLSTILLIVEPIVGIIGILFGILLIIRSNKRLTEKILSKLNKPCQKQVPMPIWAK